MRPETWVQSAFDAGVRANREGRYLADNPHRPSDLAYNVWEAGWLEEEGPTYILPAPSNVKADRWVYIGPENCGLKRYMPARAVEACIAKGEGWPKWYRPMCPIFRHEKEVLK